MRISLSRLKPRLRRRAKVSLAVAIPSMAAAKKGFSGDSDSRKNFLQFLSFFSFLLLQSNSIDAAATPSLAAATTRRTILRFLPSSRSSSCGPPRSIPLTLLVPSLTAAATVGRLTEKKGTEKVRPARLRQVPAVPVEEFSRQLPENVDGVISCLDSVVIKLKKCCESLRNTKRRVEGFERNIEDLKKELAKRKSPVEIAAKNIPSEKGKVEAQALIVLEAQAEVRKNQRDLEVREEKLKTKIIEFQVRDFRNMWKPRRRALVKMLRMSKKLAMGKEVKGTSQTVDRFEGAHLQLLKVMNGQELQIFLNEGYSFVKGDVATFLTLATDPAKLVLDAIQGFYPPHLAKQGVTFEVRKSCIFLLEQLAYLAPVISPSAKKEAHELSAKWMNKVRGNELDEVLGVQLLGSLLLITAYGLRSDYGDKLLAVMLRRASWVASHSQATMLLKHLGLAQRMAIDIKELDEQSLYDEAERLKARFGTDIDMEDEE
ncbi:unnamed protein product [Linum tenue]|uniref:FRIGIDA-like protein n=1 Tax=Linum tenue TaxID=586396 RepID=A0AAV0LDF5_9ROSI|nr:unnamed protein product [Linum tenue]